MQTRAIVGIILYSVAIAAPTAWLYFKYGLSVPVDTNSTDDLMALAGTTAVAFVLGLVASRVSRPNTMSLLDALREVLNGIQQGRNRNRRGTDRGMEMPASR